MNDRQCLGFVVGVAASSADGFFRSSMQLSVYYFLLHLSEVGP